MHHPESESDERFLKRFAEWEATLNETDFSRLEEWKYGELCALYLEADPEQRRQLPHLLAPTESEPYYHRFGHLIGYMRLVSERIKTSTDVQLLRLGLAAAAILEKRLDFRDIIVSLAFLHHAATQAGIDPAPHFKDIADMARPDTARFIRGFLRRGKREIRELVDAFST